MAVCELVVQSVLYFQSKCLLVGYSLLPDLDSIFSVRYQILIESAQIQSSAKTVGVHPFLSRQRAI